MLIASEMDKRWRRIDVRDCVVCRLYLSFLTWLCNLFLLFCWQTRRVQWDEYARQISSLHRPFTLVFSSLLSAIEWAMGSSSQMFIGIPSVFVVGQRISSRHQSLNILTINNSFHSSNGHRSFILEIRKKFN